MKLLNSILLLSMVLFLVACGDRRDEPAEEIRLDTTDTLIDTTRIDTTAVDSAAQAVNDLTGTWTGTFDSRSTTMRITEHQDNNLSGVVTINYREQINQTIKGTINPDTKSLTLKDQVHSRYKGTYNGKLSEDGKKFSGTFTMALDGSKFNFSLTKR